MSEGHSELHRLADSLPGVGLGVTLQGSTITVAGAGGMPVPQKTADWLKHEAPAVWPNTPHGEVRHTLLFGVVRDAGHSPAKLPVDTELREALARELPGESPQQREALSAAMRSKFWTTAATRRSNENERHYLLPLHASLPLSFLQSTGSGERATFRYKMFRGSLLPFLLSSPSGAVDQDLLDQVLEIFNDDRDLTVLDRKVLEIAAEISPGASILQADVLIANSEKALRGLEHAGGAFCAPSLDQFRSDLDQVLTLDLPRRDLIHKLTLLLALHLTGRLYRAGLVLGLRLDRCVALFPGGGEADPANAACAAACSGQLERCDLAGRMRFRTGSGGFRAVKLAEPCVSSYRELTSNYLLPLPVTISTSNLAREALVAVGGPELAPADLEGLHAALAGDRALRDRFDAVVRLLAVCRRYQLRGNSAAGAAVPDHLPGLHALRLALLESRRTTMRREGRDVVHQLAKDVRTGRLIANNGTAAVFFEVDEDMLHLLVRVCCGDSLIPYGEFLQRLRRYGLAPQSAAEEQQLQSALARLGMLERYSDADESAYVHHTDTSSEDDQ